MNFYKRLFKRKPVNQGIIEKVCGQLDRTAEFAEMVNPKEYARIRFGLHIEDLKTELRAFAKTK